jgi:hypothetical protein
MKALILCITSLLCIQNVCSTGWRIPFLSEFINNNKWCHERKPLYDLYGKSFHYVKFDKSRMPRIRYEDLQEVRYDLAEEQRKKGHSTKRWAEVVPIQNNRFHFQKDFATVTAVGYIIVPAIVGESINHATQFEDLPDLNIPVSVVKPNMKIIDDSKYYGIVYVPKMDLKYVDYSQDFSLKLTNGRFIILFSKRGFVNVEDNSKGSYFLRKMGSTALQERTHQLFGSVENGVIDQRLIPLGINGFHAATLGQLKNGLRNAKHSSYGPGHYLTTNPNLAYMFADGQAFCHTFIPEKHLHRVKFGKNLEINWGIMVIREELYPYLYNVCEDIRGANDDRLLYNQNFCVDYQSNNVVE